MWNSLEPLIVFAGFALLAKVIGDVIIRTKLINKGIIDEKVKYLFWKNTETSNISNVKWGLVLVGVGLAMLLDQFAPFYLRSESVIGLMFLFAGIAFLVYYFIAKSSLKGQHEQTNQ